MKSLIKSKINPWDKEVQEAFDKNPLGMIAQVVLEAYELFGVHLEPKYDREKERYGFGDSNLFFYEDMNEVDFSIELSNLQDQYQEEMARREKAEKKQKILSKLSKEEREILGI